MSEDTVHLRLYVSMGSPNSRMAMRNLEAIQQRYLGDHCRLEVIDLFEEPLRALEDGVMMTPMLLVVSRDPPVSITGNLSDPAPLLQALEVTPDERAG
ncbi:MAG: circadian clock KaiB family protein [Pseudomonadota bacterium]